VKGVDRHVKFDELLLERLKDANDIQLITGSVPLDKWKTLLEQGNPLIEGSGWGEVRDLKIADSNPTLEPDT